MPCERIRIGNSVAIVCSRGRRKPSPQCVGCGCIATRECDYPVLKSRSKRGAVLKKPVKGTCDAPLCDACSYEPKPGVDLCSPHAYKYKAREAS